MKERKGISLRESSLRGAEVNKKKKQTRINCYNLDPTKCRYCDSSLSYDKRKNKFCGHSCAASFNNNGVPRNVTNGLWKNKACSFCGKETANLKCCSNKCFSAYVKNKRRKKIEEAGSITDKKDKWYLIDIRGHKCESCSTKKWMGKPIPLDIHHKDGDSDNNKLGNLQLLCPNCHRLTPNHGSKNTANSKRQKYRKNRYDHGLSY